MSETYKLDQPVQLQSTVTVRDPDTLEDVPTTPASAVFVVRGPDGIEVEDEFPTDDDVEEADEGELRMTVVADQVGPWHWRFESTSPSAPNEGHFHVETHFPDRAV